MKVRMKATVAGTIQGQRTVVGQVVDVPDGAGEQLCSQGLAEPVAEPAPAKAEKRTAAKKSTSKVDDK